jgi:hypothetical protein
MRRALATLAFSGLLALGLSAASGPVQASALPAAGAAAKITTTLGAANATDLVEVRHRRRHWDDRRHDRRWRNRGPRAGFYFEFGPRYVAPPYYARPYYARPPYYVRPPYVAPRPAYGLPSAHVNWCYARYRSYRAADNTFQHYNGPRRLCISPYWR